MRLGPGQHLKGKTLLGGIITPEEFDHFHEVSLSLLLSVISIQSDRGPSSSSTRNLRAVVHGVTWMVCLPVALSVCLPSSTLVLRSCKPRSFRTSSREGSSYVWRSARHLRGAMSVACKRMLIKMVTSGSFRARKSASFCFTVLAGGKPCSLLTRERTDGSRMARSRTTSLLAARRMADTPSFLFPARTRFPPSRSRLRILLLRARRL